MAGDRVHRGRSRPIRLALKSGNFGALDFYEKALAALVGGRTLDVAWDDPAVAEFLADNELLWHGPTEWKSLVV